MSLLIILVFISKERIDIRLAAGSYSHNSTIGHNKKLIMENHFRTNDYSAEKLLFRNQMFMDITLGRNEKGEIPEQSLF